MPPMFATASREMSSARTAYVSTMAGKIIALPNWSGRFASREIEAMEALACCFAEIRPTMAIGRQAAKYRRPFANEMSAVPPRTPMFVSVTKPISRP